MTAKIKTVKCEVCEVEFRTRRKENKHHGYQCYPCERNSFEEWADMVGLATFWMLPPDIRDWEYYDKRLHKDLKYEG